MLTLERAERTWERSKAPTIIVGAVLLLLALPFILPSFVYQGFVESRLQKATGHDFNFTGDFSFSIVPAIRIEADTVTFTGKLGKDVETVGTIQDMVIEADLFEFLKGNIHINQFLLLHPKLTVNGDFTPYVPQWLRDSLSAARKEEVRYIELLLLFVENSIFDSAQIKEGLVQWNRGENDRILAQKINLDMDKPIEGGDFTIDANAYINDRSADLSVRLERPDEFLRGFRSKLTMVLDSAPMRIDFLGNAARRQTFVAQGSLRVDVPSLYDFCAWTGPKEKCDEDAGNLLIKTELVLRDQALRATELTYTRTPFSVTGNLALDLKGSKPEIIGDIQIPARPLAHFQPLFTRLKDLEFNGFLVDMFDANVGFDYEGITLAPGEIITPKFRLLITEGRLAFSGDQINLFGGSTNVRLRWHRGLEDGYMDVRMDTLGLDVARLQAALGRDYHLSGALKSSIEVQSQGSNVTAFIETARIRGDYALMDGQFLNGSVVKSLGGGDGSTLEFAEIKGRLTGNRGQLLSDEIKVVIPSKDITGAGSIDFLSKSLKLNLKTILDSEDGSKEGFVSISGPWHDLSMFTSEKGETFIPTSQGIHSGLLPASEEESDEELGIEDMVIDEQDILE